MENFLTKLKLVFGDKNLRDRIVLTLGILALSRVGSTIPVPGIDTGALQQFLAGNQLFGLLNLFSGGGLTQLSVFMLGVGPYITASIVMQLMTLIFPRLKEMYQEEGQAGRKRMSQYSRLLTVPLALIQAFSFLTILRREGVLLALTPFDMFISIVVIVAGSLLLMWLGELISEYGVGNGVSLIIFAGIVGSLPSTISQTYATFDPSQLPMIIGVLVVTVVVIAAIVVVTEAERPIGITYAKQVRGNKMYGGGSSYLPIRVNNAGVMPIIFALSILLFPQMIAQFLTGSSIPAVATVATFVMDIIANGWIYAAMYFVLVFFFTYFYSAVTFDPEAISTNLQKSGAFIPGVRPGNPTAKFIAGTLYKLTFIGAVFLGLVAMLPLALQAATGNPAFAIGGTGLLIVVSVAIEFVKQINAQVSMREY